ncbi:MAG: hypothetical protein CMK74_03910 [Pseudomonadales bacterium]|jgi:hypothetical protein|nr:hypothetical protein [Pseudomonadales bacterium]|tara:strand:- start:2453 stop:2842 length:390 start_codon:yes stop_codon:yes gene_type:complete
MRKLNQVEQSAQANELFRESIAAGKRSLLAYGKQIVEQSNLRDIDTEAFQEALVCADGGDLHGLFRILRSSHHAFGTERYSCFWGWIDAAGFHFDATGSSWSYITLDDRFKYLQWSTQMIEETFAAGAS